MVAGDDVVSSDDVMRSQVFKFGYLYSVDSARNKNDLVEGRRWTSDWALDTRGLGVGKLGPYALWSTP